MNEKEYHEALKVIEDNWDDLESVMDVVEAVEDYENKYFSMPEPSFKARIYYFFDVYRWWIPRSWLYWLR